MIDRRAFCGRAEWGPWRPNRRKHINSWWMPTRWGCLRQVMVWWLQLVSENGGWVLEDSGQLRRLLRGLPNPAEQSPSSILFVGRSVKREAVRAAFPYNNIKRDAAVFASLHLSTHSVDSRHPLMIIDASLNRPVKAPHRSRHLHPVAIRRHCIQGSESQSYCNVRNQLYRQLLMPFVHLCCFFVEDFEGADTLKAMWDDWINFPDIDQSSFRPRVMIVLTDPANKTGKDEIVSACAHNGIKQFASSITVLDLRSRSQLCPAARFEPLRRNIQVELNLTLEHSRELQLQLSAIHLEALITSAVQQVAYRSNIPFNTIIAARRDNPIPPGIQQHICNFLTLVKQTRIPLSKIALFIASVLVMDAYPPGMHSKYYIQ